MRGKVVIDNKGVFYVEYLTEGEELDSVEKKSMRLAFYDRPEVSVGEEIEFQVKSFYTVDGVEIATLIK